MAAAQGVSVPRLYERALWTGDAVAAERMSAIYSEVFGARRGIAMALSNVNQIAKVANSTGEVQLAQLLAVMEYLERQYEHFNAVLAQLPGGESPIVTKYENPRYLIEREQERDQ
ncbi:plasmid mobilization relaxosome protein MobC [Luteipulveratus halotolerans]|nr:plasmid mobilization relaxosome protein MobC [Luteipulveratus halotolerans]